MGSMTGKYKRISLWCVLALSFIYMTSATLFEDSLFDQLEAFSEDAHREEIDRRWEQVSRHFETDDWVDHSLGMYHQSISSLSSSIDGNGHELDTRSADSTSTYRGTSKESSQNKRLAENKRMRWPGMVATPSTKQARRGPPSEAQVARLRGKNSVRPAQPSKASPREKPFVTANNRSSGRLGEHSKQANTSLKRKVQQQKQIIDLTLSSDDAEIPVLQASFKPDQLRAALEKNVAENKPREVAKLLKDFKDNHMTIDPSYLLPVALKAPDREMVKVLVRNGAQPDQFISSKGYFLLHDAVLAGDLEYIQLLLQNGAHTDVKSLDGKTPSQLAARSPRIMKLLTSRNSQS